MLETNESKLKLSMLSRAYINTFKALNQTPKSLSGILFPTGTESSDIEKVINNEVIKYLKSKYMIVMLGNTNAGKTTLMNKILQVRILASSEKRETASIYLVEFSRE